MNKEELQSIRKKIQTSLDAKDKAREKALPLSREIIRNAANAIRAVHRGEFDEAVELMDEALEFKNKIDKALADHPDVYWAGFVHDALKEYAEARTTYALIRREALPHPDELGVSYPAYLNGIGEAVGELRRHILDQIRTRGENWGEDMLEVMDDIYYFLASMDYPAAISGNLKRTADVTRSIIEKTRGDLTTSIRSQHLEEAMVRLEKKLKNE